MIQGDPIGLKKSSRQRVLSSPPCLLWRPRMELRMCGPMERIQQWLTGHQLSLVSKESISLHLWVGRSLGAVLRECPALTSLMGTWRGQWDRDKGQHVTCVMVCLSWVPASKCLPLGSCFLVSTLKVWEVALASLCVTSGFQTQQSAKC